MNSLSERRALTRFATVEDVMSGNFMSIVRDLDRITVSYQLPDHSEVNKKRYPWAMSLLSSPSYYAARMWEYPFALLSAELQPGMKCADIGCGMTAFTKYLKDVAECEVVGVDPDLFESGIRYKGHGISKEFIRKTGLQIIQGGMENIALSSNSFDCVFCLSVIEHLPTDVAHRGIREMARILKPGGRVIITVDVNMFSEISRPLELIWESGLLPLGDMDLRWPVKRFGVFFDGKQPADVFGMVLVKPEEFVETEYSGIGGNDNPKTMAAYMIPHIRHSLKGTYDTRPMWRVMAKRIKQALLILLRG